MYAGLTKPVELTIPGAATAIPDSLSSLPTEFLPDYCEFVLVFFSISRRPAGQGRPPAKVPPQEHLLVQPHWETA